jgi:phage terminase Nu1 subunit (DNA packaging protein)
MRKKINKPISSEALEARRANVAKAREDAKAARDAAREAVRGELEAASIPAVEVSEARLMAAKAELAEIDVAERRGELIPVDKARADVFDKFATVRTRIMGVPSRVAQRLPHHANEIVPVLKELLREAMLELASGADDE